MKTALTILISLVLAIKSYGQTNENWKQFLKDSVYNSDTKDYVYLYTTKGGSRLKLMHYSLKKSKYVLATVNGDTSVAFKDVLSPNLFQIVYENYSILKALYAHIQSKNLISDFRKKFADSNIITKQLGIRYGDLHFNHFPKFSEQQIESTRNKNIAEAMVTINKLYAIFEELEK